MNAKDKKVLGVHGYAFVDYRIIWETITEDIPRLIETLRMNL
ncbi:MAG: DUF86 domain-containing protein [Firmicutes bacterium]|nr:DUF86 domain-containing protein [Bacillota bacterium]